MGPPYDTGLLVLLAEDPRSGARKLYEACRRRQERAGVLRDRAARMMLFEDEARAHGFGRVAGVDEAGRGPLAGPLVAAAVVLAEPVLGLNDSKQLTPAERETLFSALHQGGHTIGAAIIPPETIDQLGIQAANYSALVGAAGQLDPPADFLLVDGFTIPGCRLPHKRLIKGDARSQSIAAASIVAKVIRDRIMEELDKVYPGYGFAAHKGYATRDHLDAIRRLGPCAAHRKSFAPLTAYVQEGFAFAQAGAREA